MSETSQSPNNYHTHTKAWPKRMFKSKQRIRSHIKRNADRTQNLVEMTPSVSQMVIKLMDKYQILPEVSRLDKAAQLADEKYIENDRNANHELGFQPAGKPYVFGHLFAHLVLGGLINQFEDEIGP